MSEKLKSNRKTDTQIEKVLAKHFDLFYRINNLNFERTEDYERQRSGEDLLIHTKMRDVIVDEKCATKYWDRNLWTFSFELSSNFCDKRTGEAKEERYDGWFVNENNKTDFYNISYVRANSFEKLKAGAIDSLECIVISKAMLKKYILRQIRQTLVTEDIKDIEKEFIKRKNAGEIKRSEKTGRYQWLLCEGMKVVMSDNLAECPINIIVTKDILASVCKIHGIIKYNSGKSFSYENLK